MVCDNCKIKNECEGWENIEKIKKLANEILPEIVCYNIERALNTFTYCEYKEI